VKVIRPQNAVNRLVHIGPMCGAGKDLAYKGTRTVPVSEVLVRSNKKRVGFRGGGHG